MRWHAPAHSAYLLASTRLLYLYQHTLVLASCVVQLLLLNCSLCTTRTKSTWCCEIAKGINLLLNFSYVYAYRGAYIARQYAI
ncbi:hypothetical protein GQ44DRAFT_701413 [Phaeosphaeriaceae sp. PMI808]|nr:hypothetical protein GQ44DRAFT_701413 [Phaeosphaeriaceae sp. PMI808]